MYLITSQADVNVTVTNGNKSKLSINSVKGEYNALKEVEGGKCKELVVLKYGIPKKRHYQPRLNVKRKLLQ